MIQIKKRKHKERRKAHTKKWKGRELDKYPALSQIAFAHSFFTLPLPLMVPNIFSTKDLSLVPWRECG
jgi:hypothetical protein